MAVNTERRRRAYEIMNGNSTSNDDKDEQESTQALRKRAEAYAIINQNTRDKRAAEQEQLKALAEQRAKEIQEQEKKAQENAARNDQEAYIKLKFVEGNSGKVPVNYVSDLKGSSPDPSWSIGGADKVDFSNADFSIYDNGETLDNFTPRSEAERKRYRALTRNDSIKMAEEFEEMDEEKFKYYKPSNKLEAKAYVAAKFARSGGDYSALIENKKITKLLDKYDFEINDVLSDSEEADDTKTRISMPYEEYLSEIKDLSDSERKRRIRALAFGYENDELSSYERSQLEALLIRGIESDAKEKIDEAIKNNTLDTFEPQNMEEARQYLDTVKSRSEKSSKANANQKENKTKTLDTLYSDEKDVLLQNALEYALNYGVTSEDENDYYFSHYGYASSQVPNIYTEEKVQPTTEAEAIDYPDGYSGYRGNHYENAEEEAKAEIEKRLQAGDYSNDEEKLLNQLISDNVSDVERQSIVGKLENIKEPKATIEKYDENKLVTWDELDDATKIDIEASEYADTHSGRAVSGKAMWNSVVLGLEQTVFPVFQFIESLGDIFSVKDWDVEEDWYEKEMNKRSATAMAYYKEAGASDVGAELTNTIITSIIQVIPQIALAYVTGGGSAVSAASQIEKTGSRFSRAFNSLKINMKNPMFAYTFATEFADTYKDAKLEGASKGESVFASSVVGFINALVEMGGIESGETSILKNGLSEAKEELIQNSISNLTAKFVYANDKPWVSTDGSDAVFNVKELALSFLGGAVGGAAGGGMIKGINYKFSTAQQYKTYGDNLKTNTDILSQYAQYALENGSKSDVKTANEILSAIQNQTLNEIPSVKVGRLAQNAAQLYQNKYIAAIAQEESGANTKEKTKSAAEIYNTLQSIYTNPEFILNDTRAAMIRSNKVASEALSRSAGLNSTINAETPISTVKTIARMVSNGVNVNNNQSINVDSTGRVSSSVTPTQIDVEAAQRIKNGNGSLSDYLSVTGKTLDDYRTADGDYDASALATEAKEIIDNNSGLINNDSSALSEISNSRRILDNIQNSPSQSQNNSEIENISGMRSVSPQNIVEIKDGNITLDNGRTVSAENAPLTSDTQALYAASAKYKDNAVATAFINGYDSYGGLDVATYAKNFDGVYNIYKAQGARLTDEKRAEATRSFESRMGTKAYNTAKQAGIEARNEREAARSRQNERKATDTRKNEGKNKSSQKGSESGLRANEETTVNEEFNKKIDEISKMTDDEVVNAAQKGTFVTVSKHTPQVILQNVDSAQNLEMVMSFAKIYLDMKERGVLKGNYHNLGADTMKQLGNLISNPDAIVKMDNGRLNLFSTVKSDKGNNNVISIELNTVKNINNSYKKYNLVVTAFNSKNNYVKNLLSKHGVSIEYTKKDLSQVNSQLYEWLAIVNDKPSANSISQNKNTVNDSISEKTSTKGTITESYKGEWTLSAKEKAVESVIRQIAYEYTKRGISVDIAYVENGHNGQWNPKTNTVTVNLAANNPIETFLHEATGHVIHDYANENWQDIKNAAFTYLAAIEDVSIDDIRNHKIDQYRKNDLSYTQELIDEEIVSDMIGVMAQDKNSVQNLYNSLIRNGTEETLTQRIVRKLKELLMKLKLNFVNLNGKYNSAISKVAKQNRPSDNAFSEYLGKINSILSQSFENLKVTEDEDTKYSIKYDIDNRPYVVIDEDILEGVPKRNVNKVVSNVIRDKFSPGIQVGNNFIKVNARSRGEFVNSKTTQHYRKYNSPEFWDKMKSANNLDEIIWASRDYVDEGLAHERKDSFDSFGRGKVQISISGREYMADIVVGHTKNNDLVFYDIIRMTPTKIKQRNMPDRVESNRPTLVKGRYSSSNNNISQNDTVVNNSISENGESDTKLSIRETDSGEKIVVVDTDQGIFLNTDEKEQIKIATQYMNDNFKNKHLPLSDYNIVVVDKTGINKYRYLLNKVEKSINTAKYKASTELDNLLKAAEYSYSSKDHKSHSFAEYGFDYYTVKFVVGGQMFEGRLDIGVSPQGATFYGMNKIKRVTDNSSLVLANLVLEDTQSSHRNSLNDNSISQNDTVVNNSISENGDSDTKLSLKEDFKYDELIKKPDIKVVKIKNTLGSDPTRTDVKNEALKNAKRIGKTNNKGETSVYVSDIGKDVVINRAGIEHSLNRRYKPRSNIIASIGDILSNSIEINRLKTRNENTNKFSRVLLGVSEFENNIYIVKSTIDVRNSNLNDIEVLYGVSSKQKRSGVQNTPGVLMLPTTSEISVSQLLDIVKDDYRHLLSEDVLDHFNLDRDYSTDKGIANDLLYSLKEDVDKIQGVAYNNTKTIREHNEYDDFMPSGAMGKEIRNRIIQSFANKNFGNEAAIADFYFGDYRMRVSYVSPTDYKLIDFYEIENERDGNIYAEYNGKGNDPHLQGQGNGSIDSTNDSRLSRNGGTAKEDAQVSQSQSERNSRGYSGRTDVHNGQTEATFSEDSIKKYSLMEDVDIKAAQAAIKANQELEKQVKLAGKLFKQAGTVLDKSKTDAIADTLAKRYEVKDTELKSLLKDKLYAYYTYAASEDASDAQIALYGHEIAQDIAAMSEEIAENPSNNFFAEYGESIYDVISLDIAREYAEKAIIKAPKDLEQEHKKIADEYRKAKDLGEDTKKIYKELKDKTDELIKARKQYTKSRSEVVELRELLRKTKRAYEGKVEKKGASSIDSLLLKKDKALNVSNKAKAMDLFDAFDMPENATITPETVFDELSKNKLGKDTLSTVENLPYILKFNYSSESSGERGKEVRGLIMINIANCDNSKIAASTIVHECTHYTYGIGESQWAESVCFCKEKMFLTGKDKLTVAEKRDIINKVKKAYPEYNWRKGGIVNGRRC